MIPLLTVVMAFCSIVYELLLGQTMAAFLGNTVLRYSVTIGLYMLCMGVGAFLARWRVFRGAPVLSLQRVEIALTVVGGLSVPALFLLEAQGVGDGVISFTAHGLIVVVGILTGLELPLLLELGELNREGSEGAVLGWDYLGAFGGTVAFALWFYPVAGLVATALSVALLNAVAGAALSTQGYRVPRERRGRHRALAAVQVALLAGIAVALWSAGGIAESVVELYLGGTL